MSSNHSKIIRLIFILIPLYFLGTGLAFAQEPVFSDTTLKLFSVEELVKLRKILANEKDRLFRREERIRERGLDVSQEFLNVSREENANQDKILIRIAEYYTEEADNEFLSRMDAYDKAYEEYEKQLEAFERGELKVEPQPPPKPQHNYEKPIAIYDLIIKNFPESELVDDAYYSKAFLLSKMGEIRAASQVFQKIIDLFPESKYAAEAYIYLAENYFIPGPNDTEEETVVKLKKAIQLYKNVLQFKDSPRYLEALYKLGWSYYRLAGEDPEYYTDAIVYFLATVRDIERTKELDPTGELVRTDVMPEALEFIAASFVDPEYSKGGIASASAFIEKLGKPKYGIDILEKMGDRFAKITYWTDAVNSYNELLKLYPDYAYAPRIQKKIADAYLAQGQFDLAFEARRVLFERYNPKGEWYHTLESSDLPDRIAALDDAYKITEEALRTNIYYLYTLAQKKEPEAPQEAKSLYESVVDYCRFYLENYPTDENAYEIHWSMALILDTKLQRFKDAFEEYLKVSNDYLEDSHRYDAAVNAITVADTLVMIARSAQDTTQIAGVEITKLPPQELLPEEKMLAEAYDNFIKLFPDHEDTPKVLADAGALYYEHRQFDLARKYYKTMVTKFPKAEQKNIGLLSLMNSYFFMGQYRDAEIVAKKILEAPNIPEDQKKVAENRIGESIFKNAEKLEQQGEFLAAAREYFRVYTDARDFVDFEDLALFRSGRAYEKAGEWMKAIQTYDVLVENFPESKWRLASFGNIAEDYKELEDFLNVGKTLERIYTVYPQTEDGEKALYNASLFYEKAEAWEDAIRVNDTYIQRFPDRPESKDLLFENAKYYLKLGDLASANKIYKSFSQLYPDDPRTIEAFFQRGDYYFEKGRYDSAKIEFNSAIAKSEEFARTGKNPNLFYAAESYFKLGEILYQEFKNIRLTYPPNVLRAQLIKKKNKLDEVQRAFTKVIEFGSLRSFEALYKIAEAYEDFADAIANQELPPDLSRDRLLVERNRIFKVALPAYNRAVEEYKNVVQNIPILAEKLGVSLESDTTSIETAPEDTSVNIEGIAELDSTREVALKWYARAKERISLILYSVAERSSEFIYEYLRTPSPFTGLKRFAYQDRVLRDLVAPAVRTTVSAHLKNIEVSGELGLENKYVLESQRKVILTENVLAEENAKLFKSAVEYYLQSIPNLEDLIERGEEATTADGKNFYDFQDDIMQLIFYLRGFAQNAEKQFRSSLTLAIENQIENDAKLTTEEKLFNFAYEAGETMAQLAQQANFKSERLLEKYDSTFAPKYQLGSAFFDDQSAELKNYSEEVLAVAYKMAKEYQVENLWTRLILAKLAEIDPATYLADLPKQEVSIQSDTTWFTYVNFVPGWNLLEFDDTNWVPAITEDFPTTMTFPNFDSLGVSPSAIWTSLQALRTQPQRILKGESLELEEKEAPEDTLGLAPPDTSLTPSTADTNLVQGPSEPDTVTVYFRKVFQLPAKAINGWAVITGDNSYQFFLNGEYIIGVDSTDYENDRYIPFEALSEFLKKGDNLIAIKLVDMNGKPHLGLRFYLTTEILPTEVSKTIAKIKQIQEEKISDKILKRIAILNKNKIVH